MEQTNRQTTIQLPRGTKTCRSAYAEIKKSLFHFSSFHLFAFEKSDSFLHFVYRRLSAPANENFGFLNSSKFVVCISTYFFTSAIPKIFSFLCWNSKEMLNNENCIMYR